MKLDAFESWFAGWFTSDGSLIYPKNENPTISFCLHSKDRDVLDKFKWMFNIKNKVRTYNYNGKPTAHLRWKDNHWTTLIEQYNLKHNISDQIMIKDFIRGLIEGDGCYYKHPRGTFVVALYGNECHLNWVSEQFQMLLGLEPKIPKSRVGTSVIRYEGIPARLIAWYCYDMVPTHMLLNRKKEIVNSIYGKNIITNHSRFNYFLSQVFGNQIQHIETEKNGILWSISGSNNVLKICHYLQNALMLLDITSQPVLCGKGNKKKYRLYIPQVSLVNMRDPSQDGEGIVQ